VSSEKHEMAAEVGVEEGKGEVGKILTTTMVVGGYYPRLEPTEVMSRAAKVAKTVGSRTPTKSYSCEAILERLAQHLQDVAPELRQFIQKEDAVGRQRHFARPRQRPATDQTYIRDGEMWRMTGARRNQGRAVADEAGDTVHVGGHVGRWVQTQASIVRPDRVA
jgi:hypothetical protein